MRRLLQVQLGGGGARSEACRGWRDGGLLADLQSSRGRSVLDLDATCTSARAADGRRGEREHLERERVRKRREGPLAPRTGAEVRALARTAGSPVGDVEEDKRGEKSEGPARVFRPATSRLVVERSTQEDGIARIAVRHEHHLAPTLLERGPHRRQGRARPRPPQPPCAVEVNLPRTAAGKTKSRRISRGRCRTIGDPTSTGCTPASPRCGGIGERRGDGDATKKGVKRKREPLPRRGQRARGEIPVACSWGVQRLSPREEALSVREIGQASICEHGVSALSARSAAMSTSTDVSALGQGGGETGCRARPILWFSVQGVLRVCFLQARTAANLSAVSLPKGISVSVRTCSAALSGRGGGEILWVCEHGRPSLSVQGVRRQLRKKAAGAPTARSAAGHVHHGARLGDDDCKAQEKSAQLHRNDNTATDADATRRRTT